MTEQLSQAFIRRGLPKYNKARGFIKDEAAQFYFTIMKKFFFSNLFHNNEKVLSDYK